MELDIKKYLKNADITLSNDDLDLDKLSKDLRKGYTENSKIEKPDYSNYVKKDDFDKLQKDYTELETTNNNNLKTLTDTNDKNKRLSIENILIRKGFKDENFDEVIKLRDSLYSEEPDDGKAIDQIADKFKNTYFADETKPNFTPAPNEAGVSGNTGSDTGEIKITRKTSIKDLIVQK